jgi:hypothetical protein
MHPHMCYNHDSTFTTFEKTVFAWCSNSMGKIHIKIVHIYILTICFVYRYTHPILSTPNQVFG